jgi:hypothetical protein
LIVAIKIKILSPTSFLVSNAFSLPARLAIQFAKRDVTFVTRHKVMELKLHRKQLRQILLLNQAAI